MRKVSVYFVFLALFSPLFAQVALNVYEADGVTLFNNRNITVGTKLKLIVASDSNEFWSGGLFIAGQNRNLSRLDGIGKDPNSQDWTGCHWAEAGPYALVADWEDSLIQGFDLFSSDCNSLPGSWFVVDYTALAPGDPNVGFYDYDISWDTSNARVTIHQVPASDFNTDGIVNILDFSVLSSYWQRSDLCSGSWQVADLDDSGIVDVNDLIEFADNWMWRRPPLGFPVSDPGDPNQSEPNAVEPNLIEPTLDPNMIYSIVDANGYNEITLSVGDSVTLYVDMTNVNDSNLWAFNIEADLLDPNLGSIDNRAYDPNDPPGPGSARILAGPNLWDMFSGWGPGAQQEAGIALSGVSSSGTFVDGHLASFVYTCQSPGDIVLYLVNWDSTNTIGESVYPTLDGIVIHQVEALGRSMATSGGSERSMAAAQEIVDMPGEESVDRFSRDVAEESVEAISQEEMIQFLEELWTQDGGIQDAVSKEEWNEFIKSVEESY